MKGLNQFQFFDWNKFADRKTFVVTGVSEWADFDTKSHLGTKVDCIIAVDKTHYNFKPGEEFNNRFEKISFKINKDISVPIDSVVMPKNVVASIYGDYRNMLSVKCDDIVVVTPKEK